MQSQISALGRRPFSFPQRCGRLVAPAPACLHSKRTAAAAKPWAVHSSLHRRSQRCRAQPEQKLPEDVQFQLSGDESQPEMQYDEETKTLKVPLSALEGEGALRRTKLVVFTCNKCGGRTSRAVNPIAWQKGLVFGQCEQCKAWHVLAANNPKIYEEIRYTKDEVDSAAGEDAQQQQTAAGPGVADAGAPSA